MEMLTVEVRGAPHLFLGQDLGPVENLLAIRGVFSGALPGFQTHSLVAPETAN